MALYTDKGKSGMTCVIQGRVCIFVAVALLVTLTAHLVIVTVYADYAIFGAKDSNPEVAVHVNLPEIYHGNDLGNVNGWKEPNSRPFQVSSALKEKETEDEPLFDQSRDFGPIENQDVAGMTWDTQGDLGGQGDRDQPKEWIFNNDEQKPQRENLSRYVPQEPPHYKHHGDGLHMTEQPQQPSKQGPAFHHEIQDMMRNSTRELFQKIMRRLHSKRTVDETRQTPPNTTGRDQAPVVLDRHYSTHSFQGRNFDKHSKELPEQQKYRVDMVRATVQNDPDLHLYEMQGDSPVLPSGDDGTTHQAEPLSGDKNGKKEELATPRDTETGDGHRHRAEAFKQEAASQIDTVDTVTTQPSTEKQEKKKHHHKIVAKPNKKPGKKGNKNNKKSKKQKPNKQKTQKTPSKFLPKIEPSEEKKEKEGKENDDKHIPAIKPEEVSKKNKNKFRKQRKKQPAESGLGKTSDEQLDTGELNDNQEEMTKKEKRRILRQQKQEVKEQFGLLTGAVEHGNGVGAISGGNGAAADFAMTNTANNTVTQTKDESKLEKATNSKRFKKLKGRIEARITKEDERRKRKERREKRGKGHKVGKGLLSVSEYNVERTKGSEEWEATDDLSEARLIKADSEVKGRPQDRSRRTHSKKSSAGLN